MGKTFLAAAACVLTTVSPAAAQEGAQAGDPMRIVIMVDNSQTPLEPLPQIRRRLQQFVKSLRPNHELMLVTTHDRNSATSPNESDGRQIAQQYKQVSPVRAPSPK